MLYKVESSFFFIFFCMFSSTSKSCEEFFFLHEEEAAEKWKIMNWYYESFAVVVATAFFQGNVIVFTFKSFRNAYFKKKKNQLIRDNLHF